MRAIVDFVDCNDVWRDVGELEATPTGFTLHLDHGRGTRVFPLDGRRAEVYVGPSDEPLVIDEGWHVYEGRSSEVLAEHVKKDEDDDDDAARRR